MVIPGVWTRREGRATPKIHLRTVDGQGRWTPVSRSADHQPRREVSLLLLDLVLRLHAAFAQGWSIESIEPVQVEVRPDLKDMTFSEGGPKAWFVVVRRA